MSLGFFGFKGLGFLPKEPNALSRMGLFGGRWIKDPILQGNRLEKQP